MTNYEFCADCVTEFQPWRHLRVLDFGCGAGEIVNTLKDQGIEAFGCDVFYEAGNRLASVRPGYFGSIIKKIEGKGIPFETNSFDFVINNQVMEHVEDLGPVLAEIHRVLKPGGVVLSLFPDKGVWREPHCGIPFLHWFPKGSRWRYYYAFFMRTIGLGSHKNQRTRTFWSEHFCEYLDKWTHYRTRTEIENLYDRHFREIHYLENRYFMKRLENRPMVTFIPPAIRRFIVRKHAGVVFTARKPEHEFAGVRLDQLG